MKTLQSAKWAGLGLIPQELLFVPLATTLLAALCSSWLGAWLFQRSHSAARKS